MLRLVVLSLTLTDSLQILQILQAAAKYKIGDGGHMDNSGLLPILQRKARPSSMYLM